MKLGIHTLFAVIGIVLALIISMFYPLIGLYMIAGVGLFGIGLLIFRLWMRGT